MTEACWPVSIPRRLRGPALRRSCSKYCSAANVQPEADEAERDAVTGQDAAYLVRPGRPIASRLRYPQRSAPLWLVSGQSATLRSRIMVRRMTIDPAYIAAQPAALLLGADTAMQGPGRTRVDDMETASRSAAVLVPIAVAPARTVLPVKVPEPLAEAL